MAQRQNERLRDQKDRVRVKRYFYVLRPVLALRWMRLTSQPMPPMDMASLRAGADLDPDVSDALDELTAKKLEAKERGTMDESDPALDELIQEEMALAHSWLADASKSAPKGLWDEASALHLKLSMSKEIL